MGKKAHAEWDGWDSWSENPKGRWGWRVSYQTEQSHRERPPSWFAQGLELPVQSRESPGPTVRVSHQRIDRSRDESPSSATIQPYSGLGAGTRDPDTWEPKTSEHKGTKTEQTLHSHQKEAQATFRDISSLAICLGFLWCCLVHQHSGSLLERWPPV